MTDPSSAQPVQIPAREAGRGTRLPLPGPRAYTVADARVPEKARAPGRSDPDEEEDLGLPGDDGAGDVVYRPVRPGPDRKGRYLYHADRRARAEGLVFRGREHEAALLADLVLARTEVVLHGPPGRGKTSLARAGLLPSLVQRHCRVLPVARVSGPLRGGNLPANANVFAAHAVACWAGPGADRAALVRKPLDEVLAGYRQSVHDTDRPTPLVAIFDPFDDFFTGPPSHEVHREGFFKQLARAFEEDPLLRVVFAVRDEFVTRLVQLAAGLPERARARVRLTRLSIEAATDVLRAALAPAEDEAALLLARGLAGAGEGTAPRAPLIEPLLVQLACRAVTARLQPRDAVTAQLITKTLGQRSGWDTGRYLEEYYEDALPEAVRGAGRPEPELRRWLAEQLADPTTRGAGWVLATDEHAAVSGPGTPATSLHFLRWLAHTEPPLLVESTPSADDDRPDPTFYELAHELLAPAILSANAKWESRDAGRDAGRQEPLLLQYKQLQASAKRYQTEGEAALLAEPELSFAERWRASPEVGRLGLLTEDIRVLIEESRRAENDRLRTQNLLLRISLGSALLFLLATIVFAVLAWLAKKEAERSKAEAKYSLAKLDVSQGNKLLEAEDVSGALLWYAEALTEDPAAAREPVRRARPGTAPRLPPAVQRGSVHHARLGAALRQLPRLVQLVRHRNLAGMEISQDGLRLLTVGSLPEGSGDEAPRVCRVWEVESGREIWSYPYKDRRLYQAAFSPDGRSVVTAAGTPAGGGEVAVWDVQSNQLRWSRTQDDPVTSAVFRPRPAAEPAGRRGGAVGGPLVLPDFAALLGPPPGAGKSDGPDLLLTVSGVGPSQGASVVGRLASLAGPSPWLTAPVSLLPRAEPARLWDARTGKVLQTVPHPGGGVGLADFSPDGQRLVTVSDEAAGLRGVFLWEIESLLSQGVGYEPVGLTAAGGIRPAFDLAAGFDAEKRGTPAAFRSGGAADTSPASSSDVERVSAAVFSPPDGRFLLTLGGPEATAAYLWDLHTRQAPRALRHDHPLTSAAFSPNGRRAVTTGQDGTVRVWSTEHGGLRLAVGHASSVYGAAFSPDGRLLATAGRDQTTRVWDAATGKLALPSLNDYGTASRVFFSRGGRRVVVQSRDTVRVWELATEDAVATVLRPRERVSGAVLSPDGGFVVTLGAGHGGYPGEVLVWDARTGQCQQLDHGAYSVTYAAFSPDGRWLVTAGWQDAEPRSAAWLWDFETGELRNTFVPEQGVITFAAFDRDSRRLVTAANWGDGEGRGEAQVWELAGGIAGRKFSHDRGAVTFAAFSPRGDRLVTASKDDTAKVWDVATGELLRTLPHTADVTHASFSPTEDLVLTAGADLKAVLWDAASGQRRAVLRHNSYLDRAAFSPDGRRILTAAQDGTVRVWDVSSQSLVALLRHRGAVYHASFAAGGSRAVTLSYYLPPALLATPGSAGAPEAVLRRAGAGGFLRVCDWDLSAYDRSVPDARLVGELIAARKYDGDLAELVQIEPAEAEQRWQAVREKKYRAVLPARARDPGDDDQDWHTNQAGESQAAGQWFAAAWHLGRLIAARRTPAPDLFSRRAKAYAELGEWRRADEDYSRAVALRPKDRDLYVGRAQSYAEQGEWRKAGADFARALGIEPDSETRERPADIRYYLALVALGDGRTADYRAACADMVKNLVPRRNAMDANLTAWTCALSPESGVAPARLVQLAEQAVAADPGVPEYMNTLGVALYRAGRLAEAIQRLEQAPRLRRDQGTRQARAAKSEGKRLAGRFDDANAWDCLFLAMAHAKAGFTPNARDWLRKATSRIDKAVREKREDSDRAVLPWYERLELDLLRGEADALLNSKKP
jgi:WD40 repeat protein/tetratricopeptide (TPR) repeat protein